MTEPLPVSEVTIVIPAFKAEATIARTIDSLLAQDADLGILVVVDGDLDRTAAIVGAYADPRMRMLVNSDNLGAQVSRNRGLASVASPFVMFVDADDHVEGRLVPGVLAAMRGNGADLGLGPYRMVESGSGRVLRAFVPDFTSPTDVFMRWFGHARWTCVRSDMVPPVAVMWSTEFLRAIGGWDEAVRRNQDGELVMRAVLHGARIAQSREGAGIYMKYPGQVTVGSHTDQLGALLDVADKVLALETSVVPPEMKRRACAAHVYGIAWRLFDAGQDQLGRQALARSRALGFRGNWGSLPSRLLAGTLGLRGRFWIMRLALNARARLPGRRLRRTPPRFEAAA